MLNHVAGVVLVGGGMVSPDLAQEVDCSVAEVQMELTFCGVACRDDACAAEAYRMYGGSAEPMLVYSGRARLTEERVLGLYYITEIGEGG